MIPVENSIKWAKYSHVTHPLNCFILLSQSFAQLYYNNAAYSLSQYLQTDYLKKIKPNDYQGSTDIIDMGWNFYDTLQAYSGMNPKLASSMGIEKSSNQTLVWNTSCSDSSEFWTV